MTVMRTALCERVKAELALVLDGTADDELYDHLGECETCRDLRHGAENTVELVRSAGADFVLAPEFLLRLRERLDAHEAPNAARAELPPGRGTLSDAFRGARERVKSLPRWGVIGAALGVAAAAAAIAIGTSGPAGTGAFLLNGWKGRVAEIISTGHDATDVVVCAPDAECTPAGHGTELPSGSRVRTTGAGRARIQLADGSELTLDSSTEVELLRTAGRRARLTRGRIVADVVHQALSTARFEVPTGHVEVVGTKFALRADAREASVNVSRGSVRLVDARKREVLVRASEAGTLREGEPPTVSATTALGEALAWSDLPDREANAGGRGLGQLVAKKPGTDRELKNAVRLTTHAVKVRIAGTMARTEIDEVFTNHTDDVLEGIYRFPIPPDASIERLALEVDGQLVEGAFTERERAAAIWRGAIVNGAPDARKKAEGDIVWVPGPWRDPALLEWQRGNRFELRIYPIPKHGSRRIVLAYTQLVAVSAGTRQYTYPLAHDPSDSTGVARFSIDAEVRGHDAQSGVRAHGYELARGHNDGVETMSFHAADFIPSGDLTLQYALPHRDSPMTAWSFAASAPSAHRAAHDQRFVAVTLRPKLPRMSEQARRDFAIVVDSSRSMYGESYKRATRLATRLVRELDSNDRVTVLTCDESCREIPSGYRKAGPGASAEVDHFLSGTEPEGASDPTAAIRAAAASQRNSDRALRVVYLGDGTPTVGTVRASSVAREIRESVPRERASVITVAVGSDADTETLAAMARAGGGAMVPYVPGDSMARAAFAVLAATHGTTLRDVRVELPEGLVDMAPRELDSIVAGGEALVVAKMAAADVRGPVILRGSVGDKPFEQRYDLELTGASSARGNAFVPRTYAAVRIRDLERQSGVDAKEEAVRLSREYSVASRYTSLLVLESAAMFRAFGLDNTRQAPLWTGEDEGETAATALDDFAAADESSDVVGDFPVKAGDSKVEAAATGAAPQPSTATSPPYYPSRRAAPEAKRKAPWSPGGRTPLEERDPRSSQVFEPVPSSKPFPRMIPMRRIWERTGSVRTERLVPRTASAGELEAVERDAAAEPNRRDLTKKLVALYALSGDVQRAQIAAERWSERDPLDPEALTARADLAARSGDRERAIRLLGSVLDVRPGDIKAQRRLARLHRWSGRSALACRYEIAAAEMRLTDAKALTAAVSCAREGGHGWLADALLGNADVAVRKRAASPATAAAEADLSGDVRVEAVWDDDVDLDLALLAPDGSRLSWLGAPTRAVISARDVVGGRGEQLAIRGAPAGEYVVEVVRAKGEGRVRGKVTVAIGSSRRTVPFELDGVRATIAIASVELRQRLVPVSDGWR